MISETTFEKERHKELMIEAYLEKEGEMDNKSWATGSNANRSSKDLRRTALWSSFQEIDHSNKVSLVSG